MRLWSVNPKLLDVRGLVACWREGLLAQKCLMCFVDNEKCGYINHSQLIRFKYSGNPVDNIQYYLYQVYLEAKNRGFNFDRSKLPKEIPKPKHIPVNNEQVIFELNFLREKIIKRNPEKEKQFEETLTDLIRCGENALINSTFKIREGGLETWEKT